MKMVIHQIYTIYAGGTEWHYLLEGSVESDLFAVSLVKIRWQNVYDEYIAIIVVVVVKKKRTGAASLA